jgi:hypothetical protein
MANNFSSAAGKDIGTSPVTLYTVPAAKKSILIELDVCNTTSTAVTIDVVVYRASVSYYLAKNVMIPNGATLKVVDGQKVVLIANDQLRIISSAATSCDALASILEDIA